MIILPLVYGDLKTPLIREPVGDHPDRGNYPTLTHYSPPVLVVK